MRPQDAFSSSGKNIDATGAGSTMASPGWLTQLNLLWSGKGVRIAAHAAVSSRRRPPLLALLPALLIALLSRL